MLIVVSREELQAILQEDIKAWEGVGGGPNIHALTIDPKLTDPQILKELGYYENKESWLAGTRIARIREYLDKLSTAPLYKGK